MGLFSTIGAIGGGVVGGIYGGGAGAAGGVAGGSWLGNKLDGVFGNGGLNDDGTSDGGEMYNPTLGSWEEMTQGKVGSEWERMLANKARANGPSASANYLMDANRYGSKLSQGEAQRRALSAGAAAYQANARKGTRTGARERINLGTAIAGMNAAQNVRGQEEQRRLGILSQDEINKSNLQASMLNLAEARRKEELAYELDKYRSDKQAWANQQETDEQRYLAKHTGGLGGSGGFLGLGFDLF